MFSLLEGRPNSPATVACPDYACGRVTRIARRLFVLGFALASAACSGGTDGEDLGEIEQNLKPACPPAETVLGIDIASYQHPGAAAIDWTTVAANRRFVIIKATEDTGYVNPYYADDSQKARAAGMIVGAYHYLGYTTSGAAQAQHFLSAIGGNVVDGDFAPMLDVENSVDSATQSQRVSIMKEWLDTVEQATGRTPMIYSGSWYWGPYLGSPSGYGGVYPMVWAAYVSGCPQIPDDFPDIAIWQYLGGDETTPGINAACDQDRFYGNESDLLALAGSKPDFRGEPIGAAGQSYPIVADGAVTVEVGQTVTGWVKLENTGTQSWEPGVVFLAPIPRDQPSPFQSPSWASDHRISTPTAAVAPGEVGQFELDITGSEIGDSILSLGWVADGITWFADPPKGGGPTDGYFAVRVKVVAESASGGASGMGGSAGGVGTGGAAQQTTLVSDDSGCSCRTSPRPFPPSAWWLGFLLFFGLSRRAGARHSAIVLRPRRQ